jgi:hypothetical protein
MTPLCEQLAWSVFIPILICRVEESCRRVFKIKKNEKRNGVIRRENFRILGTAVDVSFFDLDDIVFIERTGRTKRFGQLRWVATANSVALF